MQCLFEAKQLLKCLLVGCSDIANVNSTFPNVRLGYR